MGPVNDKRLALVQKRKYPFSGLNYDRRHAVVHLTAFFKTFGTGHVEKMYTKTTLKHVTLRLSSENTSVIYVRRGNDVRSSMSSSPELDALTSAARHLYVVVAVVLKQILLADSLLDWPASISN